MINPNRPILISVAQYIDELEAGTVTIFDLIEKASQLGVAGLELRREMWPNRESELTVAREKIESLNLTVTYATQATLFNQNIEGDTTLRQDIDTAAALGSPVFRVFPGQVPDDNDEAGWAIGQGVVDYAASQGVTLALENYNWEPGNTLAEVKSVLDRIESPHLGTNIDIGNYDNNGQDNLAAIQAIGHRAIYSHLKDRATDDPSDLTYLGGGSLSMDEIVAALDALPQQIYYCFEFRGGGEPDQRIEKSLAYLRQR
ncbi:MAG: sugar phosphate isomerase/epimerase family protein [Chloroflexota bacterium]